MFGVHSAHHQEVSNVNCTYAASGIVGEEIINKLYYDARPTKCQDTQRGSGPLPTFYSMGTGGGGAIVCGLR
jgi:hypothetical protein